MKQFYKSYKVIKSNKFNFKEKMLECSVCCKRFRLETNLITCPNDKCNFIACQECIKKYILEEKTGAKCMNCKLAYTRLFLIRNLKLQWVRQYYDDIVALETVKRQQKLILDEYPIYNRKMKIKDIKEQIKNVVSMSLSDDVTKNIIANLNAEINELYKQMPTRAFKCPIEKCAGLVDNSQECNICKKTICIKCQCVTDNLATHVCDENVLKNLIALQEETKPCPKCNAAISKIEGCSQMWCIVCRCVFDWNSGLEMPHERHIHNPHYLNWMRENKQVVRDVGDQVCGGLVHKGALFDIDDAYALPIIANLRSIDVRINDDTGIYYVTQKYLKERKEVSASIINIHRVLAILEVISSVANHYFMQVNVLRGMFHGHEANLQEIRKGSFRQDCNEEYITKETNKAVLLNEFVKERLECSEALFSIAIETHNGLSTLFGKACNLAKEIINDINDASRHHPDIKKSVIKSSADLETKYMSNLFYLSNDDENIVISSSFAMESKKKEIEKILEETISLSNHFQEGMQTMQEYASMIDYVYKPLDTTLYSWTRYTEYDNMMVIEPPMPSRSWKCHLLHSEIEVSQIDNFPEDGNLDWQVSGVGCLYRTRVEKFKLVCTSYKDFVNIYDNSKRIIEDMENE